MSDKKESVDLITEKLAQKQFKEIQSLRSDAFVLDNAFYNLIEDLSEKGVCTPKFLTDKSNSNYVYVHFCLHLIEEIKNGKLKLN
tara:strand:- start:222 stop:476 length:255 start_codon:yes stop_codon:yes gene_type:complete